VPVTSVEDMSQTLSDAAFGNRRNVLKAVLRKNRTEDVDRPDRFIFSSFCILLFLFVIFVVKLLWPPPFAPRFALRR